jgi:hypothetical protein
VKARPGYARAVDAWVVPGVVDMMRSAGREAWPEIEALLARDQAGRAPGA